MGVYDIPSFLVDKELMQMVGIATNLFLGLIPCVGNIFVK